MANMFSEKPILKVVMLKGQDGADGEEKLINQADGSGLSFWIGTQAEYDAIPVEDLVTNCVYYITDNTSDNMRTDINAIDTKVDTNYTDLSSQINSRYNTLNIRLLAAAAQIQDMRNDMFYESGESGTITYHTAGYTTSNAKDISFSIPLPKILSDGLTITGSCRLKLRQGGSYIAGSSADVYKEIPTANHSFSVSNNRLLNITVHSEGGTAFANAVNNDVIGVDCIFSYSIANATE